MPLDQLHPNDVATITLRGSMATDLVPNATKIHFRKVYFSMCFEADVRRFEAAFLIISFFLSPAFGGVVRLFDPCVADWRIFNVRVSHFTRISLRISLAFHHAFHHAFRRDLSPRSFNRNLSTVMVHRATLAG